MTKEPFDGKPKHLNVVPLLTPKQVDRFWSRVDKTNKCWEWKGTVCPKTGYGIFPIKHMTIRAHRLSYEFYTGKPLPANKVCDHLCRNRACVNPVHIEMVDSKTNILRGVGVAAINARKIKCVNGHEFKFPNVYVPRSIHGRHCRKCLSINLKKRNDRTKVLRKFLKNIEFQKLRATELAEYLAPIINVSKL